jgi:hypothetical protein
MVVQGLERRVLFCGLVDVRWDSSFLFTTMGRAGVWKFDLDVIVVCWDFFTFRFLLCKILHRLCDEFVVPFF